MKSNPVRIFGLDLMRALAIIMVLISHAAYIFPEYNNIITDALQLIGVQGVEVFFVLSGFLIGSILLKMALKEDVNFKTIRIFWLRRWLRTLPLYYIVLLVNIAIAFLIHKNLPVELWKYFLFLQNFDYGYLSFFSESWSLSIEEFAYILAPIAIYSCSLLFSNKRLGFLTATVGLLLFFFSTKLYYYYNHLNDVMSLGQWNSSVKASVIYRLDAVYYGFLFAYLSIIKPVFFKKFRYVFAIFGVVLFVVIYGGIIFVFKEEPLFWNVIYLPVNSIAIGFFLPFLYYLKSFPVKITNWITKISRYSYAIYLLHYTFIFYLLKKVIPFESLSFSSKTIYVMLYFTVTYVLSSAIYRYFEKPILTYRNRHFPSK